MFVALKLCAFKNDFCWDTLILINQISSHSFKHDIKSFHLFIFIIKTTTIIFFEDREHRYDTSLQIYGKG